MSRPFRYLLMTIAVVAAVVVAAFAGAIAFGTADPPPPLASINQPFQGRSYGGLPPLETFKARDGAALAYRRYAGAPERVIVLIHGSTGQSSAVHDLAMALRAAGSTVYAPDLRGHGRSGRLGDIGYLGQLDDDLADLVQLVRRDHPAARLLLAGHSSGGGFVLRVGAGRDAGLFDGYLVLAPFLHHDAPTTRVGTGGWARPYIPRFVALSLLDRVGLPLFQHLPVVAFASGPDRPTTYSYRLQTNFRTHRDWRGDLAAQRRPVAILVGARDELFVAEAYAPLVGAINPAIGVQVVEGVDHMGITLDPVGIAAVRAAADRLFAVVQTGVKSGGG
jgi:pimeloyl-ACP methyl ester carboxylesterase